MGQILNRCLPKELSDLIERERKDLLEPNIGEYDPKIREDYLKCVEYRFPVGETLSLMSYEGKIGNLNHRRWFVATRFGLIFEENRPLTITLGYEYPCTHHGAITIDWDIQHRIRTVLGLKNFSYLRRNSQHACSYIMRGVWTSDEHKSSLGGLLTELHKLCDPEETLGEGSLPYLVLPISQSSSTIKPSHTTIIFCGGGGSGVSTLINSLAKEKLAATGISAHCLTHEINTYPRGPHLTLVDTPATGFDHSKDAAVTALVEKIAEAPEERLILVLVYSAQNRFFQEYQQRFPYLVYTAAKWDEKRGDPKVEVLLILTHAERIPRDQNTLQEYTQSIIFEKLHFTPESLKRLHLVDARNVEEVQKVFQSYL